MTPIYNNHTRCPNCADLDSLGWSELPGVVKTSNDTLGGTEGDSKGRHFLGIEIGRRFGVFIFSRNDKIKRVEREKEHGFDDEFRCLKMPTYNKKKID